MALPAWNSSQKPTTALANQQDKDDEEVRPVPHNRRENHRGFDHPWNWTPKVRKEFEKRISLLLGNFVVSILRQPALSLCLSETFRRSSQPRFEFGERQGLQFVVGFAFRLHDFFPFSSMHTGSTTMSERLQVSDVDRWRLQTWLRIQASAKPKVYQQVFESTEINSLSYWLEIFFSAGIATFGLVESSPAVIIGAMLISPLMGPIMATGLALAVGDLYLGIKAVLNLLASVAVSIAFSGFLVWLLPFHSATSEILARTNPNLLDLGIALLSGLAGSVVVCRGGGDGVTALPGVAIAVALMPPLCTMGFGLGSGRNLEIMGGAGLLFLTNLVAIVASAFLVFLLVGMSTPEVREAMARIPAETSRWRESCRMVQSRGCSRAGGQLRWRILMLLVLLASVAVPLRRALLQVASETLTRGAVQDELKRLVPSDAIVSQQVSCRQGRNCDSPDFDSTYP